MLLNLVSSSHSLIYLWIYSSLVTTANQEKKFLELSSLQQHFQQRLLMCKQTTTICSSSETISLIMFPLSKRSLNYLPEETLSIL